MFRVSAVLLTFGLGCLSWGSTFAGYAESENGMQGLLEVEEILVKQFELYLDKAEQERDSIMRFLDYVNHLHKDMDEPEDYFGNPLNAYTIISRFANNWQHEIFDVVLAHESFTEFKQRLANELGKHELEEPTSEDLLSATRDLLDMQEIDGRATSELANDVIFADEDRGENVTLSASDCYVIGRHLCQEHQYDDATEWLLQARHHASHDASTFPNVSQLQILEHLAPALQELGNNKLANKLNNDILKSNPTHEAALKNKIALQKKLALERIHIANLKVDL
ncbi:prolyl 4-hydroxylase subunit alpha-1-like [Drosophila montana]|uniref:prolyl 4-hydroxylase subunit alpha-1-like n=1 Tax=Drosophila montana TaxID=40370 RepID=UPI00313E4C72